MPPTPSATAPTGETPASNHRVIVGVGASAGGFEAFKRFLDHVPTDTGMAFVFVQHLDPTRPSLLVELLGAHAKRIPVVQAEDGAVVEPDRVYVIPPDATLTIENEVLHVVKPAPARAHRRPIDTFLAALAEDQGELAVGVILSGVGSDGTDGVRAIKEHGGLTLAQASADETALSGMPSSAAATGQVDFVLPVTEMPAKLAEYRQHLISVIAEKGPDGTRQDAPQYLTRIATVLRAGIGHDFSQYKEKTMVRRIQRRMQVLQIDAVPAYIEHLRTQPDELELLFQELLIGVTHFFRDAAAFEMLERDIIPKLVEQRGADDEIRVWVPGCATGEEAHSIAILLKEATARFRTAPKITIFGTDINEQAIQLARAGRYREVQVANVTPARLARWFARDDDHYRPIKEVREMCIFSTHSLVKDPPFSRLDLISCRNVLIYLNSDLQERLVRLFHYALRPNGHLFFGTSEGVARQTKLFEVVDRRQRIFARRDAPNPGFPNQPDAMRPEIPDRVGTRPAPTVEDTLERTARRVMERYTPAYVVIDRQHDILRFSGNTGRYLGPTPGAASLNLFALLRRQLRPIVRAAVQQALTKQRPFLHEAVTVANNGNSFVIDLIVEPIAGGSDGGVCVVAFRDRHEASANGDPGTAARTGPGAPAAELEAELTATRARLQATIDELETANEEMKSANEEYQSVNEELQSANEELETSKEEMQSINEELQTVNAELNSKNEVLSRANSDLRNLLDSTEIATIFLDGELRVSSFTPAMTDLFHLREGDRGRPITEIVNRLSYDALQDDVERVLRTLAIVERELSTGPDGAGSTYIMRIRPYRTIDNVIDGVVITFVDITRRRQQERDLARLVAIVSVAGDAIIGHRLDGTITGWNDGAEKLTGYSSAEALGKSIAMLMPSDRQSELGGVLDRVRRGERIQHFIGGWLRKDRSRVAVSASLYPATLEGAAVEVSWVARQAETGLADAADGGQ